MPSFSRPTLPQRPAQLPPSQWKSARTTNAIERLNKEFKRRIKTQTVLPSAETAAILFWAKAAVIADYDAQSAVERELVLRLASLLWRLRRATSIETGLFDIQADHRSRLVQKR